MSACCCSSPYCQKYGCINAAVSSQNWNQQIPSPNFIGYSHPVQTGTKPHKCPVCDGVGTKLLESAKIAFDEMERAGLETKIKCNACINGIVWG